MTTEMTTETETKTETAATETTTIPNTFGIPAGTYTATWVDRQIELALDSGTVHIATREGVRGFHNVALRVTAEAVEIGETSPATPPWL